MKKLAAGKMWGSDEVMVEWIKYGGDRMTYVLWLLVNMVWLSEKTPEEWAKGVISLLYKEGDPRDPLNYRGITLLSVVAKLFASVLNRRLMSFCEEEGVLAEEQAGFRTGRSCMDQIFTIKEILEIKKKRKEQTFTCFIDIRKAYDSVFRDALWCSLWEHGIRGRMARVLRAYYESVQSCVKIGKERTDWFEVETGLRQGCVMSPILFDIFLDGLILELRDLRRGVLVDPDAGDPCGERLCVLAYADDLVLLAESEEDLQVLINQVASWCRRLRLKVNLKKTKVVVFGRKPGEEFAFRMGGESVEEVDQYRYLGIVLEDDWHWEEAELLQRKVGRRILGCDARLPDAVVYGDLGWITLWGRRVALRLIFWGKLVGMGRDRLARKVYEAGRQRLQRDLHPQSPESSWCTTTRNLLTQLGMEDAWHRNQVDPGWREEVWERVRAWEADQWRRNMSGNSRLELYNMVKQKPGREPYLDDKDQRKRRLWSKLRGGCLETHVETGRWVSVRVAGKQTRLPRHLRVCQMCQQEQECATHLLFGCKAFILERTSFLQVCTGYAAMGGDKQTRAAGEVAEMILRGSIVAGPQMEPMWRWLMGGGSSVAMVYLQGIWEKRKRVRKELGL